MADLSMQPYFGPGMPSYGPSYDDILKNFRIGGGGTFQLGLNAAAPSQGISPEHQQVLDIIRKNQDYSANKGMSEAQALAVRRGIGGSSIEQFGTQSANEAASRAAQDSSSNVLLENARQQQAMKQLQAQALFARAQQEGNLTSDELASLRNMAFGQQQLALQQSLGQQGLDIARQNIDASRDIARGEQRNQLIGTGAQLLAPYFLPQLLGQPGGQGGMFNMFGGGFQSPTGMGAGGVPLAPGYGGGSAGFPMFGSGGSFLNTAGTSAPGFSSLLPGLAGYSLGQNAFGTSTEGKVGGIAGGALGSMYGPGGAFLGSFLGQGAGNYYGKLPGAIKAITSPLVNPGNTIKQVSHAVTKVFPF